MNVLVDTFPTTVTVQGVEYPIDWDHRSALHTVLAFEDPGLTTSEKVLVMLANTYPKSPPDREEAIKAAMTFLNGGLVPPSDQEPGPKLCSFSKDSGLIFAAFQQTHQIDLSAGLIHWWKFLALFMDLGQDTAFCQLVALRKRVKSGTASKEERKMAREMGDAFEIPEPDTRSLEEREQEAEFMRMINGQR